MAPIGEREGWARHIEDSIQIAPLFPAAAVRHHDLGSGGGLPAVPIRICRRHAGWGDVFTMIEADGRKAAFLRAACRDLGLAGAVVNARAEDAAPGRADVVTARALAPLADLLALVARHLAAGGVALLPKGRNAHTEVEAAMERWSFDLSIVPSRTAPDASILRITRLKAAG